VKNLLKAAGGIVKASGKKEWAVLWDSRASEDAPGSRVQRGRSAGNSQRKEMFQYYNKGSIGKWPSCLWRGGERRARKPGCITHGPGDDDDDDGEEEEEE